MPARRYVLVALVVVSAVTMVMIAHGRAPAAISPPPVPRQLIEQCTERTSAIYHAVVGVDALTRGDFADVCVKEMAAHGVNTPQELDRMIAAFMRALTTDPFRQPAVSVDRPCAVVGVDSPQGLGAAQQACAP